MARAGGDKRGSVTARRARKKWLASPEAGFGGDGCKVPCAYCGRMLSIAADADINDRVEADRIEPGGSYGFSEPYPNVRPACRHCNAGRSNRREWVSPLGVLVTA